MTPFTPMALRDLYRELVKYPALAAELTDYQKDKLWRHAEDEAVEATRPIVDMMEGNPDYPYPEEYRNGREVEYLLSKHSPAYRDSQRVLQLLSAAPAPGAAGVAQFSLRQVALLYIYKEESLNRLKANDAAAKAGYTSPTSGQQLMQHYNKLAHHVTNRIGVEGKALTDMIDDIGELLSALNGTARQQAESELQTLRAKK